jgi:hypothetical protein
MKRFIFFRYWNKEVCHKSIGIITNKTSDEVIREHTEISCGEMSPSEFSDFISRIERNKKIIKIPEMEYIVSGNYTEIFG